MILAADEDGGIGYKNELPWHRISEDMKFFKQCTEDNVVVMGRNTWNSLGKYAPLPNRINYVISSQDLSNFPGAFDSYSPVLYSIPDILRSIGFRHPTKTIYVVGGKTVYDAAYHMCDQIILTRVHRIYECDTFCDINKYLEDRDLIASFDSKEDNPITFEIWA
jgi:dihydrofolate reductase